MENLLLDKKATISNTYRDHVMTLFAEKDGFPIPSTKIYAIEKPEYNVQFRIEENEFQILEIRNIL